MINLYLVQGNTSLLDHSVGMQANELTERLELFSVLTAYLVLVERKEERRCSTTKPSHKYTSNKSHIST